MGQAESLMITVHEYMAMPEGSPYHQLIEGELFMSPSPNWRHQKISRNIERILERYLEKQDLGELFHAPMDVILNETNVYQPDVLFFTYKGNARLGERCVEGAPDFVVEILSESTAHLDRDRKRKIYAQRGVKELWFVDPQEKQIIVFDLQKSAKAPVGTYGIADAFNPQTFAALTIDCAEIFRGV
jgi:Uma2 family endonuclease